MLGSAVLPQGPHQLVQNEDNHGDRVKDKEDHLIDQGMREETKLKPINGSYGSAIGPWARVASARFNVALALKQLEGGTETNLLCSSDNSKDVLGAKPKKGMPVADPFVVKTYLDEKHRQHAVERNVVSNRSIKDDLAPECALLRVDHNLENGCDLNGEHKPTLRFLEFDQSRSNGHAGP